MGLINTRDKLGFERIPEGLVQPDRAFGPSFVSFANYQIAIQSCLEALGTRMSPIPVVMSVVSSPQTVSAALRSGGHPMLLDVDPATLQIDPESLKEALEGLEACVVILNTWGGQLIDDRLLELTKDYPVMLDTKLFPSDKFQATFSVFDVHQVCAAVRCGYSEQSRDLKMIRSGALGHSAHLSYPQRAHLSTLSPLKEYYENCQKENKATADEYTNHLRKVQKTDIIYFKECDQYPYYLIKVSNARKTVVHLDSYDIEVKQALFPLHQLTDLKDRWVETPSYPNAESLTSQVIALPTHEGARGRETEILEKVLEVYDG